MFDWDRFKKGEIAVHCDNEEKAKDFLKECKDEGIKWSSGRDVTYRNNWENYEKDTCYCCFDGDSKLGYSDYEFYIREGKGIIKWEDKEMKELTFTEVIANIKEGEVWEGGNPAKITIRDTTSGIEIKGIDDWIYIGKNVKFKLQRKEYTFEEAFKAYEEGKEIESVIAGTKFRRQESTEGKVFDSYWDDAVGCWWKFVGFDLDLIRGKWYIND